MGSSQSRVAKMGAGDLAVSLDVLVHGLVAAGGQRYGVQRRRASAVRCNALLGGAPRRLPLVCKILEETARREILGVTRRCHADKRNVMHILGRHQSRPASS
jgi:hypothetical protein